MKHRLSCAVLLLFAIAAFPALAAEATFTRSLAVNGHVELGVSTGSGNIHITRGSDSEVHIFGRVKSNFGSENDDRVRELAAHPPIEQTGNIIRIGSHHENLHNISIDYDIQAPANVFLAADSGSGNVTVEAVGDNAKLSTGSGYIHATGLEGGFNVETGSGNIYAEQTGQGNVRAQSGSGNIELRNLHGGLRAGTGSGDIKAAGTPAMDWKLETGSGSIEFWSGNAPFTMDASTGSGSIHTDVEVAAQVVPGSFERHHITGKVHGGGPKVRMETGSGNIKIH
ncbi:MAG TPA: DUF4097 family beta strand repeat-containing protein [Terracidiphilus sp.]|nr:DUF4097 family beta strand repeat-containing protein [Terracidiphilus sp.]